MDGAALARAKEVRFTISPGQAITLQGFTTSDDPAGPHRIELSSATEYGPLGFVLECEIVTGPNPLDVERSFLYLRLDRGEIVADDFESHLSKLRLDDGSYMTRGHHQPVPENQRSLPPWDNPHVLVEDQEVARRSVELGSTSSALTLDDSDNDTDGDTPEAGCGASGGFGSTLTLVALGSLALALRFRRRPGLVALAMLVGVPSTARATLVFGYVSFWDTRVDKSNATGSRLPTCNTANTTCSPESGTSCCFRGIPNVTVEFWQNSQLVTSYETLSTGFFLVNLNAGPHPVSAYVAFRRTGGPGPLVAFAASQPGGQPARFYLGQFYVSGSYQHLGNYPLNLANDTSSFEGNLATAWANVTALHSALVAEGEVRHKIPFGSPNQQEQSMNMVYFTNKDWVNCSEDVFYFRPEDSRLPYPIYQAGTLYHGRVVGCSPIGYNLWNWAAFPEVRGRGSGDNNSSTSEGLAHGLAYRYLAHMLARWNPSTASFAAVVLGTGITCVIDTQSNSNDAAYPTNNALALWELLDTESAFEDAYDDTIDITMTNLMNGLAVNSTATGANMSGNEAVYNGYQPPLDCTSNQNCGAGDACVANLGNCFGGDPHGGNVFDVAYHLTLLAIQNQWPTGYLTTIESSPCVGPNDNSHPYTGGYRSD